jgi:acyl-coenzyme A thioesterase PaaI-like protein
MDAGHPMSASHGAARVRFTEVEAGSVGAQCAVSPRAPRASLLTLADAVLGSAVTTALPTPGRVATLQMAVHFLTSDVGASVATARATAVSTSTKMGASTGEIVAPSGRVIATMSTRCAVVSPHGPPEIMWDPERRPDRLLELVDGYEGEDTDELLNLQLTSTASGHASWRGVAAPGLGNLGHAVQGGVLAHIGAFVLENLFGGTDSAGYDLIVDYRRSIAADGRRITAEASIDHGGRRLGLGTCVIRDADGRDAAIARISRFVDTEQ